MGVTALLWLIGASALSWNIGHLADHAAFYGSLGGAAITLMFFYISAIIFILGAELNSVWRERTGHKRAPQNADSEGEAKMSSRRRADPAAGS